MPKYYYVERFHFKKLRSSKSLHNYISLECCTFKLHSYTLFWIVYLNVIVHIVTVSKIIHARTINSGSSMLLTFEIISQVKGISFCREMPKSSRGIPFMHLQVTVADPGEGRKTFFCDCPNLSPPLQGRSQQFGMQGFLRWYCCERHWVRVHVLR